LKDHIYALTPEASLFIGKRNLGHTCNYYLGEPINDDEVAVVQAAAEKFGVDVLNTRFFFHAITSFSFSTEENRVLKNGPNDFTLLVASAQTQVDVSHEIDTKQGEKAKLKVQYGDFSADLVKVVKALEKVC
jgi:dipeptidyl-peptidase-3